MSRTIWIPDHGASDSPYMPIEIPEPGEPGYISPADRIAAASPDDPLPATIAREQAIEEALAVQSAHLAPGCKADTERRAVSEPDIHDSRPEPPVIRPEYLDWTAEPEPEAVAEIEHLSRTPQPPDQAAEIRARTSEPEAGT